MPELPDVESFRRFLNCLGTLRETGSNPRRPPWGNRIAIENKTHRVRVGIPSPSKILEKPPHEIVSP